MPERLDHHNVEAPPQRLRRDRFVLGGILLLALALRLFRLDFKSLWLDEAWTWWQARKPLWECIHAEYSTPPLSYVISWFSVRLIGDSEFALRLPSALSGVLATWLVYRLGARLFDVRTARLAALLFAAAAFHLRFTQEARAYGFLTCAVLASTEALIGFLRQPTRWRAMSYVVLATIGLYLHYVFGLVVLAHNAAVVLWWRRQPTRPMLWLWFVTQAAVGALFLPWAWTLFNENAWVDKSYLSYPFGRVVAVFFSFVFGFRRLFSASPDFTAETIVRHGPLIVLLLVVFLPLAWRGVRRTDVSSPNRIVLTTLFGVTFGLVLILAAFTNVRFTDDRYLSFLCPFWLLLIAAGIAKSRLGMPRGVPIVVAVTWIGALGHYYTRTEIANENWRAAAHRVLSRRMNDDLICVHAPCMHMVYEYYDREAKELLLLSDRREDLYNDAQWVSAQLERRRRVWLVLGHFDRQTEAFWANVIRAGEFEEVAPRESFPSPAGGAQIRTFVRREPPSALTMTP